MAPWLRSTLVLLASVASCLAAEPNRDGLKPGSPDELRGVTRIFVDAGKDPIARQHMSVEIQKTLPRIVLTSNASDAEVLLVLSSERSTAPIQSQRVMFGTHSSTVAPAGTRSAIHDATVADESTGRYSGREAPTTTGHGLVLKPVSDDVSHVLLKFEDTETSHNEDRLSTSFARAFTKAWLLANRGTAPTSAPPSPQGKAVQPSQPLAAGSTTASPATSHGEGKSSKATTHGSRSTAPTPATHSSHSSSRTSAPLTQVRYEKVDPAESGATAASPAAGEAAYFVNPGSDIFHRQGCTHIVSKAVALPLARAAEGRRPCDTCHPPLPEHTEHN